MNNTKSFNRRKFLKASLAGACTAGILKGNRELHADSSQNADDKKIKEYRILGRTGFKVSDIGIGASFLTDPGLLDRALKMGLNYIDSGEHYSGGRSESTIGEVINKHDRKSIFITTKINISRGNQTKETIKARFQKCLERMKTGYVDCLMIHMARADQIKHEGFHAAFEELKSEGKARFFGLSNHGKEQSIYGVTGENMEDVVLAAAEDGRFDVVLFVYNFLQKEQGEKIIRKCKEKNMGATLMKTNPIGVYLRKNASVEGRKQAGRRISEAEQKRVDDYKEWITRAEAFKEKYNLTTNEEVRDAAIKFTLTNPDVHSVCPSIRNFEDLETYAALSGKKLDDTDSSMLLDYEKTLGRYYCRHACGMCEPSCPHNVPVNTIMRYNHYFAAQGKEKHAMLNYAQLPAANADKCSKCEGICQSHCPYNVPVQGLLVTAHQNLTMV